MLKNPHLEGTRDLQKGNTDRAGEKVHVVLLPWLCWVLDRFGLACQLTSRSSDPPVIYIKVEFPHLPNQEFRGRVLERAVIEAEVPKFEEILADGSNI